MALVLAITLFSCSASEPGSRSDRPSPDAGSTKAAHHTSPRRTIGPGLCRLEALLRSNDPRAYDTYSSIVHNPLHEVINEALDEAGPSARKLARTENLFEITLLSDSPTSTSLKILRRMIPLIERFLGAKSLDCQRNGPGSK